MPSTPTKSTPSTVARKSSEVAETQRIKGTKKLPPLSSKIPVTKTRRDMQQSELESSSHSSADSKRQDGVGKTRTNNKRRMAARQATSTNSASPSAQKRSIVKSKGADSDSVESQPRTKPRKKAATKSKSQDKTVDAATNGQEPMNSDGKNSAQWTNIAKRAQMHRPQKTKGKHLKRKDASKRKKSEYVIENTWIPRDANNSNPKTSKKSKSKNNKAKESSKIRDGNDKVLVEISGTEKPVASEDQRPSVETLTGNDVINVIHETKESRVETPEVREPLPSPAVSSPIKLQHSDSSSKVNSRKVTYSPKLSNNRETTQIKQINVADFAKLKVEATKSTDAAVTNLDVADYRHRVSKVRFKGASNSVPNYNEKQENIKKTVAQNDSLLATVKQQSVRKEQAAIHVSKIEPKTSNKASMLLLPTAGNHRNHFMDLLGMGSLGSPEPLPRLQYGSPTPLHGTHHESDDLCEVSIVVPKLPQLHKPRTDRRSITPPDTDSKQDSEYTNTTPPTEEEPLVIVTNENGVSTARMSNEEREGWESGYSSMTPRLSVDSRSHAITPMSSFMTGNAMLEIPNDPRSLTPFSTITSSTYLDHSRPQSTFLDPQIHDTRRFSTDFRFTNNKLPAIHSRSDKSESADDRRYDFTPLPLQSIRTSDGELSD